MDWFNFTNIQVLVCVFVGVNCVFATGGPLCYSCDLLPHQRDCNKIVQCGSHESCYGQKYFTPGAVVLFKSGCKATVACSGRRQTADNTLCQACCTHDYCNIQTCDIPIQLGRRCLACDDVIDPRLCTRDVQCDADQMCYTEEIYNANKEKRFRLGCTLKTSCGYDSPVQVGKRYDQFRSAPSSYCAQCCDTGTNCNRELCLAGSVGYDLLKPPPLLTCFDFDTSYCLNLIGADASVCNDRAVRYLTCPARCGACVGGGVLPIPQTTSYVQPTTAPPSGHCPPTYELQRCQLLDCALHLCCDHDLRPLCQEYCSGTCLKKDCSNTKFHIQP